MKIGLKSAKSDASSIDPSRLFLQLFSITLSFYVVKLKKILLRNSQYTTEDTPWSSTDPGNYIIPKKMVLRQPHSSMIVERRPYLFPEGTTILLAQFQHGGRPKRCLEGPG